MHLKVLEDSLSSQVWLKGRKLLLQSQTVPLSDSLPACLRCASGNYLSSKQWFQPSMKKAEELCHLDNMKQSGAKWHHCIDGCSQRGHSAPFSDYIYDFKQDVWRKSLPCNNLFVFFGERTILRFVLSEGKDWHSQACLCLLLPGTITVT